MNHSDKRRPSFVQRTSSDLDSLLYANYGKTARYSVKTESGLVELDLKFDNGMICVTNAKLTVRIYPISEIIVVKAQIIFINFERNFPDYLLGYNTPQSLAREIHQLNYPNCIKAS